MTSATASASESLAAVTRWVNYEEARSGELPLVTIGLTSNVTVSVLETYLRRAALRHGRRAVIRPGSFDDPIGNMQRFADEGVDHVVRLDLFDAFAPSLETVIRGDRERATSLVDRFRDELALCLERAATLPRVDVALLHRFGGPPTGDPTDEVDAVIAAFNDVIVEEVRRKPNAHYIATSDLCSTLGWTAAHDPRSYQRFRAPFAPSFLSAFADRVALADRGFGAFLYKALVVDGDNTLWGGVLGEDLATGIRLDPQTYPGRVYWEVQHALRQLRKQGVLLCLSSKNDAADVDALLATHPSMVLRRDDFAALAVDWEPKTANLARIAAELNIGLDSMIFLDDSTFEIEAVRAELPQVRAFEVPQDLSAYPETINGIRELFAIDSGHSTSVDDRTGWYRIRAAAETDRARHATHDEYLASLGMRVTLATDVAADAPRVAELSQRSNQFNLTTRRYSESEIRGLMAARDADVHSIRVEDRFGDSGLTGVVIVRHDSTGVADIDSFFMSCRVLGRGVEHSFWPVVFAGTRASGAARLRARYVPTPKNGQVATFWESVGFSLRDEDQDGGRTYELDLASPIPPLPAHHVEVVHGP